MTADRRLLLAAIAVSAGTLFALEILAIRLLIPLVGSEGRTLSLTIAAVVTGAAIGTEAGRRLLPRGARLVGRSYLLGALLVAVAPWSLGALAPLAGEGLLGSLLLSFVVIAPPAALLSLPYPILAGSLAHLDDASRAAGAASGSSNLGAMVGVLLASLPVAGLLPTSTGLLVVAAASVGVWLIVRRWR